MRQARRFRTLAALLGGLAAGARPAAASKAAKLGGSPASMEAQHAVAVKDHLAFAHTAADVRVLADSGRLDRLTSGDYRLADVSFPYARPEVRVFVERLAAQYRAAQGAPLVVTSLTRPLALQPANAHALSVHPAGMAVDFRVPADAAARAWLESALLGLERAGVLDVTREHTPPHYHVAVYPDAYRAYAERQSGEPFVHLAAAAARARAVPAPVATPVTPTVAAAASTPPDESADGDVELLLALLMPLVLGALAAAELSRHREISA